MFKTTFNIKIG